MRRFLELVGTPPDDRYAKAMEVFAGPLRRELWEGGVHPAASPLERDREHDVRALQILDIRTYLANDLLPKADLASMAHSLELRSPFLDHEVVELGLSLPEGLKVRGRRGKVALRRAFGDLLPPELTARRKAGFGLPLAHWFRSELREQAHDVLVTDGLFRRDAVERLLVEHERGRADHGHRLWCLLVLELWRRTWLGRPAQVVARAG